MSDEAIIHCNDCDIDYTTGFEFISDLDWTCPKCKKDNTFIVKLKFKKRNNNPVELGRCNRGTVWRSK